MVCAGEKKNRRNWLRQYFERTVSGVFQEEKGDSSKSIFWQLLEKKKVGKPAWNVFFSSISWKFRTFLSSVKRRGFKLWRWRLSKQGFSSQKNIFPFPLSEKKVAVQVYFEKQVHSPSSFIFAKPWGAQENFFTTPYFLPFSSPNTAPTYK